MANPIADSDAAIVKINNENSWPYKSSKYIEKTIKFKFRLNRTNSIHIKVIRIFRRLTTIPIKLIINKKIFAVNCLINIIKNIICN